MRLSAPMGNFKISIEAVGGHGIARDVKQGETIPYALAHEYEPDRLAFDFVDRLKANGCNVIVAELTHWPESTPIVDNLLTAKREIGSFGDPHTTFFGDEPILRFFPMAYGSDQKPDPLARTYCHFAYDLVRRLPRSAERTLALRDLLASYDNAKRARP